MIVIVNGCLLICSLMSVTWCTTYIKKFPGLELPNKDIAQKSKSIIAAVAYLFTSSLDFGRLVDVQQSYITCQIVTVWQPSLFWIYYDLFYGLSDVIYSVRPSAKSPRWSEDAFPIWYWCVNYFWIYCEFAVFCELACKWLPCVGTFCLLKFVFHLSDSKSHVLVWKYIMWALSFVKIIHWSRCGAYPRKNT